MLNSEAFYQAKEAMSTATTTSKSYAIEVGMKLWYGPSSGMNGQWVTVSKVGRKWFEWGDCANGRAEIATLIPDRENRWGRWRYGRFYFMPEDWRADLEAKRIESETEKAWEMFRRAVPYIRPEHLTLESIAQLTAILFPEK